MTLDPQTIRSQFPALRHQAQHASPAIFLDNPGGTQIAQASLERITAYLTQHNANHGGAFATSQALGCRAGGSPHRHGRFLQRRPTRGDRLWQ